jgi:hypothetical protein
MPFRHIAENPPEVICHWKAGKLKPSALQVVVDWGE